MSRRGVETCNRTITDVTKYIIFPPGWRLCFLEMWGILIYWFSVFTYSTGPHELSICQEPFWICPWEEDYIKSVLFLESQLLVPCLEKNHLATLFFRIIHKFLHPVGRAVTSNSSTNSLNMVICQFSQNSLSKGRLEFSSTTICGVFFLKGVLARFHCELLKVTWPWLRSTWALTFHFDLTSFYITSLEDNHTKSLICVSHHTFYFSEYKPWKFSNCHWNYWNMFLSGIFFHLMLVPMGFC